MKKITEKITQFIENFKNVHAEARKIGFAGKKIWNFGYHDSRESK